MTSILTRMELVLFLSLFAVGVTSLRNPRMRHPKWQCLVDTHLEKRQLFGIVPSKTATPKQAIQLKKLVPAIDEKATRELKMWGPFKLTASNVLFAPNAPQ
jgi:hypothetical protein